MANYDNTVEDVQKLLNYEQEWKKRYNNYIEAVRENSNKRIKRARNLFHLYGPFRLYLSISYAKKATGKKVYFDLRFHGQNVGLIIVDIEVSKAWLIALKNDDILNKIKDISPEDEKILRSMIGSTKQFIEWSEATEFRKIYKNLEEAIVSGKIKLAKNKEHELESHLLGNWSKNSSEGKEILNIQPVSLFKPPLFFQMPTPLKASKAKSGSIDYAAEKGGGIDILARIGGGKGTYLAIIELKDKFENSEQPEDAICQAIAYATFIRELLRSESGKEWWKFFGFGGGIPKALKLYAIIAMPNNNNADTKFVYDSEPKGKELLLGKNDENYKNDKLELGYIYLESDGLPQKISENLPLENNKKNS